jgi:hypothetical protein
MTKISSRSSYLGHAGGMYSDRRGTLRKEPKLVRKDVYAVNKNHAQLAGDESNEHSKNVQNTTTKRRCYTCGSENHLRNRCPKTKRENGGAFPQGKGSPPRQ